MRNLKIFPKMFLNTFAILGILIVLVHLLIFLVFPRTYFETRKQEINSKANEISQSLQGKDAKFVEQSLEIYSKSSEIKAFIRGNSDNNEVRLGNHDNVDLSSNNNSLIIEEREIKLNNGRKVSVQFVSTADMQRDAKELSFKFLPLSITISLLLSVVISLIYAKTITNNIQEIKDVTTKMMELDRGARLKVESTNEVGQLKAHINDLYATLLELIDDLEVKNSEILKLERIKYDFFRGASHELKTPLASLKIILENMKFNIGKYRNRDEYIGSCIDIVDGMSQNISQILSISSLEHLKDDEEWLEVNSVLQDVIDKYSLMASNKKIVIANQITDEKMYIGRTALQIVLSNLISNAVKYSDSPGKVTIGVTEEWIYVNNTCKDAEQLDIDRLFEVNFDLSKENSNGLGLYIVRNILLSYGIEHKVVRRKSSVTFMIKLSVPE